MAFVPSDRVKETSSSTGTGNFTLGGAPTNYQTFNNGVGVGNFCWYCINNLNANEWEVGYGQLTGATTLARLSVMQSTNSDAPVAFSAGTKEVFVTLPSAFNNQTLGRTNMIINPHGSIRQEASGILTANGYIADQWGVVSTGSGFTWQSSVAVGSVSAYDPSYMYMTTTSAKGSLAASDSLSLYQLLEGSFTRRLLYGTSAARTSWIRFRASASQSATASVALRNGAQDRSFVQSFPVTTTPTDIFIRVPGDTTGVWNSDTSTGAQLSFCFAAGTTFQTATLGAWQAGTFFAANTQTNLLGTGSAQLNITDVQWSVSEVLLPFEPIDYATELARCQRYFQAVTASARFPSGGGGQSVTNTVNWPIMRVTPSATFVSNQSAANVNTATLVPAHPYGGQYEMVALGAGDAYVLGSIWALYARMT